MTQWLDQLSGIVLSRDDSVTSGLGNTIEQEWLSDLALGNSIEQEWLSD
jgi:hypothetical protein